MLLIDKLGIHARRIKPWQIDLPVMAAILLASLSTYFALLRPMARRSAEFADNESVLAEKRRRASQLKAASLARKEDLTSLHSALAERQTKLQPSANLNRQVAQIAALLTECSLTTDDIQPGGASGQGGYNVVPIALTGRGGYRSCAAFLHRLSQTFPDTGVTSFELSGSPAQPRAAGNFRLVLKWYTAEPKADEQG
jgi:Tfp pilus assembly protein PilO